MVLLQIEKNRLHDLDYEFLISQLCVLNNKPYADMQVVVDFLLKSGRISVVDAPVFDGQKKDGFSVLSERSNEGLSVSDEQLQHAYSLLSKRDNKSKANTLRVKGKIDMTRRGYAFLLPFDEEMEDVFIAEKDLKGANNGDTVIVDAMSVGKSKLEGKVLQVIERANQLVVGTIYLNKKNAIVVADDVKFSKDIYVPLNKVLHAKNGQKVFVKVERFYANKKLPDGVVVEVLGDPDTIETDLISIIRSYNLFENFPKVVLEIADKIPEKVEKEKLTRRRDLTKLQCFTIDGEDSRDFDDAISLEINKAGRRVLGVHIADVGEYVPTGSVIDKEAYKRGTSIYFPTKVLPMLPQVLSNGICSLQEGELRLTLSAFIEFDENAKVVDFSFCESTIISKKRFTYNQVQKVLDNDSKSKEKFAPFVETLTNMNKLAKQILRNRDAKGAVEFNIPEVTVETDNLGAVVALGKRETLESHKLIEAFMVIANECVAEFFFKKKLPFVYRVHEKPDAEKMEAFLVFIKKLGVDVNFSSKKVSAMSLQQIIKSVAGKDHEYAVNRMCLRALQKAKYNTECLGHFCLASTYYCHFTSPIRRYPDLTIHRIMKDFMRGLLKDKRLADTRHTAQISAINSSITEVVGEKVERDVDDLYRAYFMKDKIGQEFDAIVSGVTNFGIFVSLDNTVEGIVKIDMLPSDYYEFVAEEYLLKGSAHKFYIGKKVRVKLLSVNTSARQIDFVLV